MSWERGQLVAAAIAVGALAAAFGYLALRAQRAEALAAEIAAASAPREWQAPDGLPPAEARRRLAADAATQEAELAEAERLLVAALPGEWRAETLSEATALVSIECARLRQQAALVRLALPARLPLEDGLDAEAARRSQQLVQLLLVRSAVGACLEAGIERIAGLRLLPPAAGPEAYALFALEAEGEAGWPALARLLAACAAPQPLAIQALQLGPPRDERLAWRATFAIVARRQAEWQLGAPPAPGGGRLRRLGGAP